MRQLTISGYVTKTVGWAVHSAILTFRIYIQNSVDSENIVTFACKEIGRTMKFMNVLFIQGVGSDVGSLCSMQGAQLVSHGRNRWWWQQKAPNNIPIRACFVFVYEQSTNNEFFQRLNKKRKETKKKIRSKNSSA